MTKSKKHKPLKSIVIKKPTNNRKALTLRHRRKVKKTIPPYDKLIKMMQRPAGTTMEGLESPAMRTIKLAGHRGYETKIIKRPGQLPRYYAKLMK